LEVSNLSGQNQTALKRRVSAGFSVCQPAWIVKKTAAGVHLRLFVQTG
jgi:hypothetical protein